MRCPRFLSLLAAARLLAGDAPEPAAAPPPSPTDRSHHTLRADGFWALNLPDLEPFGASGLLWLSTGNLLTLNDRGPEIYRVRFLSEPHTAALDLAEDLFPQAQMEPALRAKPHRIDCEGLGRDEQGRFYLCDESDRWILRWDPARGRVERLDIDWTAARAHFHPTDRNASFEGIAAGGGRLYVANERSRGRVFELDLQTLRRTADFAPRSDRPGLWDMNYSDLAWFEGRLFALLRERRLILEIDPGPRTVVAEYDYLPVEEAPEHRFLKAAPVVGVMEGLAVDPTHFWLVTDNNHRGREVAPDDRRPRLFRCPRPNVKSVRSAPGSPPAAPAGGPVPAASGRDPARTTSRPSPS